MMRGMKLLIGFVAMLVASAGQVQAGVLVRQSEYSVGQYGYQGSAWNDMTSIMDNGGSFTKVADFSNASQVASADALWIDLGDIGAAGTLSASEQANVSTFIASGRRVVMIGENNSNWSSWNTIILGLVGGSPTSNNTTGFLNTIVTNELTAGVSSIEVLGGGEEQGIAGGIQLFDQNVASLWGGNVLTYLDINGFTDTRLPRADNRRFAENIVDWISATPPEPQTGDVPEPTSLAIFGLGALGLAGGAIRRRKKQRA